jgi:oxygen-dependent protoporphyrinogen oxidase
MSDDRKKIIIVGGGISGLSAAFYAQKYFQEKGMPVDITLLEQSNKLGGKIQTLHRDGFVIEKGPDSFLARKMPIIDLSKDLGIEQEFVGTNPDAKKTYILHKGKLHRMPPGLILGIPTEVLPFLQTGLISVWGKARAAMDLILPRRTASTDESLGHFLERRLGKEVVSHIAEPLLAGIYAGDTRTLSLQATFPQFGEVEKKYRSLILGMLASKKKAPQPSGIPEIAKNSMFITYKQGLSTLVETLVDKLEQAQVSLKTNQHVTRVNKNASGYEILLENQEALEADSIIFAIPPTVSSTLLASHTSKAKELESVRYVSVANVIMAFDRDQITHKLDGSGFVVPRKEGRYITACTWTSSKWLHTAPEGKVMLRCYVGRSGDEEIVNQSDGDLIKKVQHDLKELMGIDTAPSFYEITRWPSSMPQYPLGHVQRIKEIREELSSTMPGVLLTGSGYHGVGIPDCVRQGKEAAADALAFLSKK